MLRSLNSSQPVVNAKPVRRRDYSVELQCSGPAVLPAIYRNLHIVGFVLGDAVVVRESVTGTRRDRFTRGDCYIRGVGPGERVTWPVGMRALYVHLHSRLIRRLGEELLGVPDLGLRSHSVLHDRVLRDLGFQLYDVVKEPHADLRAADDLVLAIAHHVTLNHAAAAAPAPRVGQLSVETILDEFREHAPTWDSVSALATRCGLSRPHFTRRMRSLTGLSPYHMLLASRIEGVKHLLGREEASLSEVAYEMGFADQSHLTRVFKRFTGITPGRFITLRNSIRS